MKTSKRDLIIIIIIVAISFIGYFVFKGFVNKPSKNPAIIQHWHLNSLGFISKTDDLVLIDFDNEKVKVLKKEANISDDYNKTYPIVDEVAMTVTLLGEYVEPISNKRQELVIEYSFINRSVQIIEETSPKGICENMGISYKKPLICMPNQIKIIFDILDDDGIDYEQ